MREHTFKTSLGDKARSLLKLRGRRGSNSSKHRGLWEDEEGLLEPQDNMRTMGTGKEAGTLSRARRSRGVKSPASVCCRCGYNHCAHWADPHIQPVVTSSTAGLRSDSMWRDSKVHEVRVPEPRHVMKCVSTVQEEACSFCGDRQMLNISLKRKWKNDWTMIQCTKETGLKDFSLI